MAIVLLSLILAIITILYFYLTRNYKFWQKHGIPCMDGALPGVGHMFSVLSSKSTVSECYLKIYNAHRDHSMVGFYNLSAPVLMIREPALVKTVLQTNFTNFHQNGLVVDRELDPLVARNPSFCVGDEWVTGRRYFTNAFSSMRLKILLETVKQVCGKFENFLDKKLNKSKKYELELKDLFSRYTAEVSAAAAFGVEGHCFDNDEEKISFQKIAAPILDLSSRKSVLFILVFFIPWLNKFFKIPFLSKDLEKFFKKLVMDIIEQTRTDDEISEKTFLHLMRDSEKTEDSQFNLEVLTSYALSFFLDGFETSSTVLSFIGYQLACHLDVQNRLREEIISVVARHNGIITYEALKEMTYMDQVINESQRIIPTVGKLNKICTEEFELRGSDGLVYRVKPGTEIVIPVHGLHEDPKYWENPEIFDPERFNPTNKQNIERFAFLPFGEGPRMCVGMRMALLQIKTCLAVLLRKYSLELSSKTQLPLQMKPGNVMATAKGGLWAFVRHL